VYDFDSTGHLGDVLAPTLVLHRRNDRAHPFALGKDVARRIRNARFVGARGRRPLPRGAATADAVVRETLAFLGVARRCRRPARSGRRRPPHRARARGAAARRARQTDAEIAPQLVLSTHTVHRPHREHPHEARRPSRTAAAAWALQRANLRLRPPQAADGCRGWPVPATRVGRIRRFPARRIGVDCRPVPHTVRRQDEARNHTM
jgi:hypothetical protein